MAKITEVSHQQSLQTKCKMLVAITIYALLAFMSQKRFTHFWHLCRGNDLRTSSGKFLRVKVCRPESCDFLGLWNSWSYICTWHIWSSHICTCHIWSSHICTWHDWCFLCLFMVYMVLVCMYILWMVILVSVLPMIVFLWMCLPIISCSYIHVFLGKGVAPF